MGCVYLIHFDRAYKHARHYLGFSSSDSPDARIEQHRNGNGARLIDVVSMAGIEWDVSRVWPDKDQAFERRLKSGRHVPRYCPICRKEKQCQNGKNHLPS
jgi:predicted GIY-YIG superfamily endonuclease